MKQIQSFSLSKPSALMLTAVLFLALGFGTVGCSQSVDSVSVKPNHNAPRPGSYIPNVNLEGATTDIPVSASFQMGVHSFGGNTLRTSSTSASYKMTSGVGVD